MRIVSIDVGIKNLAYCIMDNTNDNKSIKIIQWDVINLCGKKIICNCSFINKKVKKVKVVENKSCNKTAIYSKENNYYCKIHAKNQIDYIIPTLKLSIKKIKKMKLVELQELCSTYKIETLPGSKKEGILDMVIKTMSNKFLDSIGEQQSANEISMIDIGIAIKNEFDKLPLMMSADKIIIENQISPIANRMKTIQGMIAQYFIMNNKNNISFISASNKLKAYTKPLEDGEDKSNYLDRKKASTNITLTLMENEIYSEFKQFFTNHKKKDDLADAFLQGISFITTF
jgi:hypothetical protein